MKWVWLLIATAGLACGPGAGVADGKPRASHRIGGKVPFLYDYAAAPTAAEEQGKPLLAYFSFAGCVACKKLEAACFSEKTVLDAAASFVWVAIDNDVAPETSRRFGVQTFPTMLVLNEDEEKIHRWEGYSDAEFFVEQLAEATRRLALSRQGLEWDPPPERADCSSSETACTVIEAPGKGPIRGLAVSHGALWCQQERQLYRIPLDNSRTPSLVLELPAKTGVVRDLTSDGSLLYLCPMGWNRGGRVARYDLSRRSLRKPLKSGYEEQAGYSTTGMARAGELLHVLQSFGRLHALWKSNGDVLSSKRITGPADYRRIWMNGLELRGDRLLATAELQRFRLGDAGRPVPRPDRKTPREHAILAVDPETGQASIERMLPFPVHSLALDAGSGTLYLAEEQRRWRDEHHRLVLIPAKPTIHAHAARGALRKSAQ